MLTVRVFGSNPDMRALAECVKYIPPDSVEALIKAPQRNEVGIRPCQFPGRLTYEVSVDNKFFITLIQPTAEAGYQIHTSK